MLGYRSNDAVLTICQNNATKSIEIVAVNEAAELLINHSAKALVGKNLSALATPRISEMLAEYVEYEHDANDVGMVLSKVQSFSLLDAKGQEHGYRLKVVRAESDAVKMHFRLVLQDRNGEKRDSALRQSIQENFRGHEQMDSRFGIPDRKSLAKDIELVAYYNQKAELSSCFSVLQLDHYEALLAQYGEAQMHQFIRHIAAICKSTLRPDDQVGAVNHKRVGVLLLDTVPETSRMVANRLRWQIAANPYMLSNQAPFSLSVSIVYSGVGGRASDQALIETCEKLLDEAPSDSANMLLALEGAGK